MVPTLAHEIRRVEALVSSHRHPLASRNFLQHFQRRIALGRARGFPHPAVHNQPVAILHQQIPAVAQLGLLTWTFARHLRFGIAFRLMRFVRALLADNPPWDFRIIRRRPTLLVLALELFTLAQASSKPPSTVKCSSEAQPCPRACSTTSDRNSFATSASSNGRGSW